jgi:hypothetical protein
MLEDHGADVVLRELADACTDRASWLRGLAPIAYGNHARLLDKQARVIRKLSQSYAIQGE